MLTSQEIKNQEFKVKFRGYEPSEVDTYLTLLSENFLELTNQVSTQVKEIVDLKGELKSLTLEKGTLAEEVKAIQDNHSEDSGIEYSGIEDSSIEDSDIEDSNIEDIKNEEIRLDDDTVADVHNLVEIEKLRTKVAVLEEMNNTLRQEELDFKTTITAAQNFSNSLKEASGAEAAKLKEDSEARAAELKEVSGAEAAKLKQESEARAVELKEESEARAAELKEKSEARAAELKETSEARAVELKEESEARAAELREASEAETVEQMEKLHNEMSHFKKQSEEKLTQLLTEITNLQAQKEQVKDELKNTLHFYLNALDEDTPKGSLESIE